MEMEVARVRALRLRLIIPVILFLQGGNGGSPSKGIETHCRCYFGLHLRSRGNGGSPSKGIETLKRMMTLQVLLRGNGGSPSKGIETIL